MGERLPVPPFLPFPPLSLLASARAGEEDYDVLAEMTEELAKVNDELEEKELRWLELAEEFPEETGQ